MKFFRCIGVRHAVILDSSSIPILPIPCFSVPYEVSGTSAHATTLTWRYPPSYFFLISAHQHYTKLLRYIGARHAVNLARSSILFLPYQCSSVPTKVLRYIGARHAVNLAESSILFPVHFISAHQCHKELLLSLIHI